MNNKPYFAKNYGLDHLLFAGYLILCAWLVTKIPFFKKAELSPSQLLILFLLKVMAGIFYGWIGVYYGNLAQMVDTWVFHYESLDQYRLLKTNAPEFFASTFRNSYEDGYGSFLSAENSWWNDLHGNLFIKVLALFNLFSFGNYYINVIFYSFLTIFGPVAIYRVMKDAFPFRKKIVLATTFFIPSFLYWTSGLHKDGVIFLGISLIIYHFYFALKEKKIQLHRVLLLLLGLLLLLLLRNYLLIIILPALLAWFVAQKLSLRPVFTFLITYLIFIFLFFTSRYVDARLDLPLAVATKQAAFLKLKGGSAVAVTRLQPTFSGFIANAPQAINLTLIRPYPSDVRHLLSMAAALEVAFLLLILLLFLCFRKDKFTVTPFLLFCFFFSFSVLLTIGYTVNFLGAIVRYRSIVLPFIFVPLAVKIDWNRVIGLTGNFIKIKNNL